MKMNNNTFRVSSGTFIFGACALVISFAFLKVMWVGPALFMLEGALIWVLIMLFVIVPSVSLYLINIPSKIKRVYVLLFFVMFLTQLMNTSRITFPFIPWNYVQQVRVYTASGCVF